MERCWYNKFSPTEKQRTKEGRWKASGKRATNGILKWARWCDEHKHDADVLVQEEE